jgi:hypothetical protein
MTKKKIIMTAGVGLLSFAGTFVLAWLTAPGGSSQIEPGAPSAETDGQTPGIPEPGLSMADATGPIDQKLKKALTEKQLKNLVYEIRENIKEYNDRLADLKLREERLETAHSGLKEDIKKLSNLQVETTSMVARLKQEQDNLAKQKVEVAKTEQTNLMSIAAAYDKMDATSAGKILVNMCVSKGSQASDKRFGGQGSNMDDAVKILYYMTERTKAKVLAGLVGIEPELTAVLVQQLKRIVEQK